MRTVKRVVLYHYWRTQANGKTTWRKLEFPVLCVWCGLRNTPYRIVIDGANDSPLDTVNVRSQIPKWLLEHVQELLQRANVQRVPKHVQELEQEIREYIGIDEQTDVSADTLAHHKGINR